MEVNKLNILIIGGVTFYKSLITSHLDVLEINYGLQHKSSLKDSLLMLEELKNTNKRINIIFSDLKFPDAPGTELARRLRMSADFKNIPLILLTPPAEEVHIFEYLAAGFDLFLPKSWDVDQLTKALDSVLKRHNIKYIAG